jgi:predicted AAA+ superfamily ATPase
MTVEDPNLLERLKKIEKRLEDLENRLEMLEKYLNRPLPGRGSLPQPRPPGPTPPGPPDPFRF